MLTASVTGMHPHLSESYQPLFFITLPDFRVCVYVLSEDLFVADGIG